MRNMRNHSQGNLPSCYRRPWKRDGSWPYQRALFEDSVEEFLVEMRLSADEVDRWHKFGWLSFSASELPRTWPLDDARRNELEFMCHVLRSGLSDHQIKGLLAGMERPYSFDPHSVAYSFKYGWVQMVPSEDPEVLFDDAIETWLESQSIERLRDLRDRIDVLIDAAAPKCQNDMP